jgi:short-subunit dehydrogenase
VLVARRESLLSDVGRDLSQSLGVKFRAIAIDLSQAGFIDRLARRMTANLLSKAFANKQASEDLISSQPR